MDGVLNAIMVARGETNKTLSEKAGISLSYLSMLKSGYCPSLKVKLKVARALNVSPHYLWQLSPVEQRVLVDQSLSANG